MKKKFFPKKTGHSLSLVMVNHKKNCYSVYFEGELIGFARSKERAEKIAEMTLKPS